MYMVVCSRVYPKAKGSNVFKSILDFVLTTNRNFIGGRVWRTIHTKSNKFHYHRYIQKVSKSWLGQSYRFQTRNKQLSYRLGRFQSSSGLIIFVAIVKYLIYRISVRSFWKSFSFGSIYSSSKTARYPRK